MDQRRLTENSARKTPAGALLTTPSGLLACLQSPPLKLTTWIRRASIVEPVTIGPSSPRSATPAASLSSRPLLVASAVETSTGPPQAQLLREPLVDREHRLGAVRAPVHEDGELP
ncbi:MAG: hypothetical protein LM580_04070, partial [Thermofilum sp.]|nr:hypothetical protein [Thermofilum sp.]MCC6064990.1 hypothetical protein [Thermofilum sp.]